MSTKTTFKRIALVAVAALGLGVLSVAPSSATVSSLAVAVSDGTSTLSAASGTSDSTTAAFATVSGLLDSTTDSVTVSIIEKAKPTTATAGLGRLYFYESTTATSTVDSTTAFNAATGGAPVVIGTGSQSNRGIAAGSSDVFRIRTSTAGYVSAKFAIQLDSTTTRTAGTYTYTVVTKAYQNGSLLPAQTIVSDVNIVVAAAATASLVVDASKSTNVISAGSSYSPAVAGSDDVVSALSTASSTAKAVIRVNLQNVAGGDVAESITATITGPGLLRSTGGTVSGKSIKIIADGNDDIDVLADGTAGTASIVVSTPSVTFAAKTVTFYAAAAKTITATVNKPVIGAGSNAAVVYATAVDANGTNWGGTAYIYAATAADALIAGSATPVACSYNATYQRQECPVSGTTAGTANFKVIDASTVALATATSNSVATRVSAGVPTTVKLAFDKATYAPGEKAQIWVTALDAAGLALPAQTISNLFTAGGITASTAFGSASDTLTAVNVAIEGATSASAGTVAGYKVYTVYMPISSGDVTISATGSTGLAAVGRVAVTATASVVNTSVDAATDAANEATDAANAATDAALAAADAADAATAAAQDASDAVAALSATVAKLVASLKAQITSLTNLVIKIQKKVRA